MSEVNWALGLQQGNAGDAFMTAFKQGQQTQQQNAEKAAMAALVADPNNPKALAALARTNPERALQFWKDANVHHSENIIKGAQILRQFNPTDQPSYTQALAAAQAAGIDISQVPQQFNPQYVQGVIRAADALKPEAQDPGPIREFDEATNRGLLPKGTTYEQFLQLKNPGMNSPVVLPQSYSMLQGGQSAPVTATGPNGQRLQLNPQTNQWEPMGGQTPQASGGFPSGPQ